jgi:hypothetical protein
VRRVARRGLELITLASTGFPGSYDSEMLNSWRTDIAEAKDVSLDRLVAAIAVTDGDGNVIDYRWSLLQHLSFNTLERIITHSLGTERAGIILQMLTDQKGLLTRNGVEWAGHERDLLLETLKNFTTMRQLEVLFDDERFSLDRWETLSVAERETLLQEFMNRLVHIFGIEVNPEINFTNTPPRITAEGIEVVNLGSYRHFGRLVSINSYVIANWESDESHGALFNTVIHELRHGYQRSAVADPESFTVSAPTLQARQNNQNNPISSDVDFAGYRDMMTEIDAREFGEAWEN